MRWGCNERRDGDMIGWGCDERWDGMRVDVMSDWMRDEMEM